MSSSTMSVGRIMAQMRSVVYACTTTCIFGGCYLKNTVILNKFCLPCLTIAWETTTHKKSFVFFMLCILCYKKIVLLFLIPGHSHNADDRVVAWCRRAMKGHKLYTAECIKTIMYMVKGVSA